MKRAKELVATYCAILSFALVRAAFAASGPFQLINPLDPTNSGKCNDISCPVAAISNFLFTISIPLVAIFIFIGGFQVMTAAGNPEKASAGKRTILYAVIGFVIILLAGSVAALIQSILTG